MLSKSLLSLLAAWMLAASSVAADATPMVGDIAIRGFEDDSALFARDAALHAPAHKRALGKAWTGTSRITKGGSSGVSGMQLAVIDNNHVLVYDKYEKNPLKIDGDYAWGSIYEISTHKVWPVGLLSDTFCAGGSWLSNGTLVSVGGTPHSGLLPGLTGVRLFTPCADERNCKVYEWSRVRLTSKRWYPTSVRLSDGSLIIFGGMKLNTYNNYEAIDNPTLEFYPPKGDGLPIYSKFLHDALNTNLFPIMFPLTDGKSIFVAANKMSMIYNWKTNTETRIKYKFPGGVRVNYPATAASALLPLTKANKYTPEVLICGGSTINTDLKSPYHLSSSYAASKKCFRMTITTAGIKKNWAVEDMPTPRVMGSAVLTPDGKVLLINGAKNGMSGFGNVHDVVGDSNAKTPNYKPVLYDPVAAAGKRFSQNFPSSSIERLYHNTATLLPDGRIMLAGSNPNPDRTSVTFKTRYDVEFFNPPYTSLDRPKIVSLPSKLGFKSKISVKLSIPSSLSTSKIVAVLMDLGYSTHGVYMNTRYVELTSSYNKSTKILTVTGPPSTGMYAPGYGWLYITVDGVPSVGKRIMVGTGAGPKVSNYAIKNMLANTSAD